MIFGHLQQLQQKGNEFCIDFHDFLKLFMTFLPFYGIFEFHDIAMVFFIKILLTSFKAI